MSANAKQARQQRLREAVRDGKINRADGSLARADSGCPRFRALAFGYKLGDSLGLMRKRSK